MMRVRLPPDLRTWIGESAERNYRSLNAEVVFWLNKARNGALATHPETGGSQAAGSHTLAG